ncbi:MAG: hypothetical protein MZV70_16145 [Desulfobacterales bacterium]|nr:hypothetical protein [Desulfobacterales bacterium]
MPKTSSLSRYAVIKPKTRIGANVLVAQRAYVENSILGKGSNAQENCFIINSHLKGNNVTAHGAKLINTRSGRKMSSWGSTPSCTGLPESPLIVGPGQHHHAAHHHRPQGAGFHSAGSPGVGVRHQP